MQLTAFQNGRNVRDTDLWNAPKRGESLLDYNDYISMFNVMSLTTARFKDSFVSPADILFSLEGSVPSLTFFPCLVSHKEATLPDLS